MKLILLLFLVFLPACGHCNHVYKTTVREIDVSCKQSRNWACGQELWDCNTGDRYMCARDVIDACE
jgi:hypothetical protein